ncbi:MAG: aminofutalosine synthase MqnE [Terriglobia bacterium]
MQLNGLQIADARLKPIADKVLAGERLSFDDGIALYRTHDLLAVGWLANYVREQKSGNIAYYNVNRHLNPSNVCVAHCRLCAFGRDAAAPGAYTMALDDAFRIARTGYDESVTEFHIVGGLHPDLPFDYFLDLIRGLRQRFPHVHLKAFTMVEIVYLAKVAKLSIRDTLLKLKEAGLGSLPGGGAEIFHPRVRKVICDHKISGAMWLRTARTAHKLSLHSNATMLYGHIETEEERVDHLLRLRALQDETRGFVCFVPLAFHPDHTALSHLPKPTGLADLKNMAAARLLLDNFPHVKAYWIMLTPRIAQVALRFGADDIDGTVMEEKIYHDAGARTAQSLRRSELIRLIREAGREPLERDTLYRPVQRSADGQLRVDTTLTVNV